MTLIALVFLFLSLSNPAAADCSYTNIYSEQLRLSALDVSLDGNDLWVATSYGVTLYDRTVDPPRPVTAIALPGTTNRVRAAGQFAYAASGTVIQVIRRGPPLQLVKTVELSSPIHDLLIVSNHLYVATSNGIVQLDLLNPANPVMASRLFTTSGLALSLARMDSTLYAADGDGTVEAYNIQLPSLPQKMGTFSAMRSNSVEVSSSRLFVSDGQQTEVYSGSGLLLTRIATLDAGATSLFPLGGDVVFIAGFDRTLRVFDLSLPLQPLVLHQSDVAPSGGSINRILALTGAPGRIYAAAGDIGLITIKTDSFKSPYPLLSQPVGATRSLAALAGSIVTSSDEGGLRLFAVNSSSRLALQQTWDVFRVSRVLDAGAGRVLTSSGIALTLWDVTKSPPQQLSSANLPRSIRSAVLRYPEAIAVLDDHSVYRVDLSQAAGTIFAVTLQPSGAPSFITRSGTSLAVADFDEEATTTIRYFGSGNLSAVPQVLSVPGVATSGVAIDDSGHGAVVTFQGLTILDFTAGTAEAIPGTSSDIARDILWAGSDLYVLTRDELQIWNPLTKQLRRALTLPSESYAFDRRADPSLTALAIATAEGVIIVQPETGSEPPQFLIPPATNRYARRVDVSANHLYLFDGQTIEMSLLANRRPTLLRRLFVPGTIDFAAIDGSLYTLSSTAKVTSFDSTGVAVGEIQIDEGPETNPLSIHALGGALFVSVARGCLTGGCEKKTVVLDPRLIRTTTLAGGIVDAVVSGNRAYVLTDLPAEIRIYDISDAAHPSLVNSRAVESNVVSIAYSSEVRTVYTLGTRVSAYDENALTKTGELLEGGTPDSSGRQRLRIEGGCAVLTGRMFDPQTFDIVAPSNWVAVAGPSLPSPVRMLDTTGGDLFFLTDHSLEIWSPTARDERKRPARR